ncbi:hypothetical protein NC652_015335 [Populus alba x Populus x berolinensis]|nr:hypothetical protein NC652_015335 [Populus alba x Populus x berolinensis]
MGHYELKSKTLQRRVCSPEGLCKASIFCVACGKGAPILASKRALEGEVGEPFLKLGILPV